ncbi:MAG: hypothetical protein ACRDRL_04790 [Sciscionella sp.]
MGLLPQFRQQTGRDPDNVLPSRQVQLREQRDVVHLVALHEQVAGVGIGPWVRHQVGRHADDGLPGVQVGLGKDLRSVTA